MAISATSPNVDNYFVGKGIVKFMVEGGTDYVDLGNCPEVEYTANIDKLDHFSSMAGLRIKDRSIIREASATLRIVMEELTPHNLALMLMGEVTDPVAPATETTISIFTLSEIKGALRFVGQNSVGAKVQWDWPNISFTPSGSINLITEEWGSMEITAEVLADATGVFGTAIWGITDEIDTAVTREAA